MKNNCSETRLRYIVWKSIAWTVSLTAVCGMAIHLSAVKADDTPQETDTPAVTAMMELMEIPNEDAMIETALFNRSVDMGTFTATAYCKCRKCCGKWADVPGTYTGAEPTEGITIAVDPKVIPLDSQVFVLRNGDWHCYTAQDTGGAIKGQKIDIYFETHEDALAFGRQEVRVRCTAEEMEK